MTDKMREEFEKWWVNDERPDASAWDGWQAATAQAEQRIKELEQKCAEQQALLRVVADWIRKGHLLEAEEVARNADTEELSRLLEEAKRVPEGMMLVPIEPSPAMLHAGYSALCDDKSWPTGWHEGGLTPETMESKIAYKAMLEAAKGGA